MEMSSFVASNPLLLLRCREGGVFCLLPKGKVRSFCTSWIGIKEPTKSRLPVRQKGALITAKREKERDETEAKALVF